MISKYEDLIGLVLFMLFFILIGVIVVQAIFLSNFKQEALQRGLAEYKVNSKTGQVSFVWNEPNDEAKDE